MLVSAACFLVGWMMHSMMKFLLAIEKNNFSNPFDCFKRGREKLERKIAYYTQPKVNPFMTAEANEWRINDKELIVVKSIGEKSL